MELTVKWCATLQDKLCARTSKIITQTVKLDVRLSIFSQVVGDDDDDDDDDNHMSKREVKNLTE